MDKDESYTHIPEMCQQSYNTFLSGFINLYTG